MSASIDTETETYSLVQRLGLDSNQLLSRPDKASSSATIFDQIRASVLRLTAVSTCKPSDQLSAIADSYASLGSALHGRSIAALRATLAASRTSASSLAVSSLALVDAATKRRDRPGRSLGSYEVGPGPATDADTPPMRIADVVANLEEYAASARTRWANITEKVRAVEAEMARVVEAMLGETTVDTRMVGADAARGPAISLDETREFARLAARMDGHTTRAEMLASKAAESINRIEQEFEQDSDKVLQYHIDRLRQLKYAT